MGRDSRNGCSEIQLLIQIHGFQLNMTILLGHLVFLILSHCQMDGELMVIQLENLVDLGKQNKQRCRRVVNHQRRGHVSRSLGRTPTCGVELRCRRNWNVPNMARFSDAEPKAEMI